MVGSLCNYLFTLFMGRMLGPANYGILVALLSLMALITIPASVINTVAMRFTAVFKSRNQIEKIRRLFSYLTKNLFLISLAAALILIVATPFINNFLKIPSKVPIILLSLLLILIFLIPITRGVLQGLQKFFALSVNICIDPLVKLLLAVILVYFGFGVNGVIIALIVASTTAYFLSFIPLKNLSLKFSRRDDQIGKKEIKGYSANVLWTLLLLTLLVNVDIILVKHFLSGQEAGFYGALSTMGKIVLFVSVPISGVMFPMVTSRYEKGEKHWKLLLVSLVLMTILGLLVLAVYFIAPAFSVKILFGNQYLAIANLLPLFGLAMLLYSICFALATYFLSISKTTFLWPLTLITLLEIVLIWFYHDSFLTIIKILIFTFALTLAMLSGIYFKDRKTQILNLIFRQNQ